MGRPALGGCVTSKSCASIDVREWQRQRPPTHWPRVFMVMDAQRRRGRERRGPKSKTPPLS